jgi:hypothetical protein
VVCSKVVVVVDLVKVLVVVCSVTIVVNLVTLKRIVLSGSVSKVVRIVVRMVVKTLVAI